MAVIDTILTGELKIANMVLANITALQNGSLNANWYPVFKGNRSVLAVSNRYQLGDTSSSQFQIAYACLNGFVGQYAGGAIDPNAQNPGTVINIISGGSTINSAVIPFTNQTTVSLSSYPTTYYPLYGANPYIQLFVSDGAGGFAPDFGTAPDYVYSTPGDPTSGIVSITWGYGVPTSGYILISGAAP